MMKSKFNILYEKIMQSITSVITESGIAITRYFKN